MEHCIRFSLIWDLINFDYFRSLLGLTNNVSTLLRYKDGSDHMGEHRDDEKDLTPGYPIASLTLGQPRDFIFKHADARGKNAKRNIEPVKIVLEHGSLLMMKHPTNTYWYHSLPQRKKLSNVRINMTFRKMVEQLKVVKWWKKKSMFVFLQLSRFLLS